MPECVPLTREMLKDPIEMQVAGRLDFQQAKDLASRRAGEIGAEPMLLAWFDRGGAILPQHHLLPGGQTLLAELYITVRTALLADLRRIPGRGHRHQHQ